MGAPGILSPSHDLLDWFPDLPPPPTRQPYLFRTQTYLWHSAAQSLSVASHCPRMKSRHLGWCYRPLHLACSPPGAISSPPLHLSLAGSLPYVAKVFFQSVREAVDWFRVSCSGISHSVSRCPWTPLLPEHPIDHISQPPSPRDGSGQWEGGGRDTRHFPLSLKVSPVQSSAQFPSQRPMG